MDNPHLNYKNLIDQLQDSEKFSVLGQERLDKTLIEVGKSLGQEGSGRSSEEVKSANRLHRRMSLVFGVAVLEAMVKDYYESIGIFLRDGGMEAPSSPLAYEDEWVSGVLEDELGLSLESWEYRLKEWANDRRREVPSTKVSERDWTNSVEVVKGCCTEFAHWRVLLKSVVVRNLEMHNGGVMSSRAHEHNPLCDIGKIPEWDNDLVKGLGKALHLLNDSLAANCQLHSS